MITTPPSQPVPGQFWRHVRTGRTLLIHEAAGPRLMVVCVKLGRGGSEATLYRKPPTRFRLSTLLRNYAPVSAEEVHQPPSRMLPHTRATVERVLEAMRGAS